MKTKMQKIKVLQYYMLFEGWGIQVYKWGLQKIKFLIITTKLNENKSKKSKEKSKFMLSGLTRAVSYDTGTRVSFCNGPCASFPFLYQLK